MFASARNAWRESGDEVTSALTIGGAMFGAP